MSNYRNDAVQVGLSTDFTADNPVLQPFIIGMESDTGKYKVGDGSTAWNLLPYETVQKTGTATLVAGSVVVADPKITATSEIQVHSLNLSGTVGALFVSVKTVGTSFTIASTNAADTSTVRYNVIKY